MVKDAPLRAPIDAGVQARLTVQVAPEGSAPLHVPPVTDTPVPVTLVPVIVMGPGLLFWTWTVVGVGWPTGADGNTVPEGNRRRGFTMKAL
jgi:hypothetical protein